MRILLLTDSYPPEIRSASHLMQELAEELRDRLHAVTVATCYPQYNLADNALNKKYDEDSVEAGIRVIRIHTLPHHKVNFIVRGLSQVSLPYIFWSKLKKHLKDGIDAVLVYSPPLSLWKVGHYVKKTFGAKYVLNIQDIFPQNAIDLGVLRNPLLIWFFERMEKKAYGSADIVTVHSPGNGAFLFEKGKIDPSKLVVLPNWVDVGVHEERRNDSFHRRRVAIQSLFVGKKGVVLGDVDSNFITPQPKPDGVTLA